jgi:hypothetical protein
MSQHNNPGAAKMPFDPLESLTPATSAPAGSDPVNDEFRALVLPSTQLPAGATSAVKSLMPMPDEGAGAAKALGFEGDQTLGDSLKQFIVNLTDSLKRAADDISSLEVRTFGTSDLSKVTYNYASKTFEGELQLRALTRIAFDGDMQVIVPEKDGELNQPLWEAHLAMVREAQANRAQFIGAMAEMAARLIQVFK